jgi:hypothetical protein
MSRLVPAISNVHMLGGDLVGADGPASVFVDIIGLPFTPLSLSRDRAVRLLPALQVPAALLPQSQPLSALITRCYIAQMM